MRELWPRFTLLPPLPFVVLAVVSAAYGKLRWDHIAVVAFVALLAYTNAATKKLLVGLYPLGLVAILYDSMRYVKNLGVTAAGVHLCDLRGAELSWFGIQSGGERITLQDYFLAHHGTALDLLCAIPYGTFIFAAAATALYLYFRDFSAMQRFMWAFLALNAVGFITYHVYPAAPPWYFHAHGCSVDLAASASEGPRLAHVDALLGFHYFGGMYGRSSDVFGAMPSLHCAYALLIAIEGFRNFRWPLRILSIAFFMLMCFSAVYLDHHWVIDAIAGIVYCVAVVIATRLVQRVVSAASKRAPALSPPLEAAPVERSGAAQM